MSDNPLSLASTTPTVDMSRATAVIHLVAEGHTVREACKTHWITPVQLRKLCREEPLLQKMLDEALQLRNEALADMLVNIDQHQADAKMASVVSKNIQWVLERNEPQKFGARLTITQDGEASKALARALNMAIERIPLPTSAAPAITDASFEIVEPTPRAATEDEMRALGLL